MNPFLEDVRAQPDALRRLLGSYRGELRPRLLEAAAAIDRHPDRPLLVVGMGSSLSAGRILPALFAARSRVVLLEDAGELLHYGLGTLDSVGAVVAISQSGRSFETVRLAESLRARHAVPVVALVNDEASPVAVTSDIVLPLLAGPEAAVATKTYLAAMAVLVLLAAESPARVVDGSALDGAVDALEPLVRDASIGPAAARHLAGVRALIVVGRGPALGTASYGALTIKEAAAIPAEAMSGGAFRHGPLELTESDVAIVVLAPAGRTNRLMTGLAAEIAERGRPTWLITNSDGAVDRNGPSELLVSAIGPVLPEEVAPLVLAVPLQLAAEALAAQVGRRAGVTSVATKVTDRE